VVDKKPKPNGNAARRAAKLGPVFLFCVVSSNGAFEKGAQELFEKVSRHARKHELEDMSISTLGTPSALTNSFTTRPALGLLLDWE
jgi:hypothetical protein